MSFKPDFSGCDEVRPSPNFNNRKRSPNILLQHYTGMDTGDAALERLIAEEFKVSAHYLVYEDGKIVQMVPEDKRAWHAGKGSWSDAPDVNGVSIGIEIANGGHYNGAPEYPEPQIASVIKLSQDIVKRHKIPPERVLGHSDTAPGRKIDPGEWFPWKRLSENGVGLWVEPEPVIEGACIASGSKDPDVAKLQADLAEYGYGVNKTGVYDKQTATVVKAFQRHFRPEKVDGIADISTVKTLEKLISKWKGGHSS